MKGAGKSAAGLRAVILAGGKGARLKPYSIIFPKPLVPLGDTPVIEVLIQRLANHGITDVTITLGHLAELIKAYFAHRRDLTERIRLRYVEEEKPTGTAGCLSLVPELDNTFLALNGDLLTNLDFHSLVRFHRDRRAALTIATHPRQVKLDLGVLEFNEDHFVTSYLEKPVSNYQVSMGIYVYEPHVLKHIEPGRYLDFPDLVLRLLARGELVCAFPTDCLWLDIGRPDDYARAQELFSERREAFDLV
jgi:NDP-sugar pyrophosphorylase family protein